MPKKRKNSSRKIAKRKSFLLPFVLINILAVFVFFLILNFYFVFFRGQKVRVLSSTVSNLQRVSTIQKNLEFKFSGRVDRNLIEKSFKIFPRVLGTISWRDNSCVFQFEENLKSDTKYSLEFEVSSTPLPFFPTTTPEVYNLQFETGEAPFFLSSSPKDEETNVKLNRYIIFNFDKNIQPKNVENYFLIKPKIDGHLLVKNNELIFEPTNKLQKDTSYFAGVLKGLPALNGQQLTSDHFIYFKTIDGTSDDILEKRKVNVPILMYHNVGVSNLLDSKLTKRFKIDPSILESHLKYISENFQAISMQELYDYLSNGIEIPKNSVIITFDDGWRGVYNFAFPILQKYHLKFTGYLISDYLDVTAGYLTKEEVREMLDSRLFELGNHTTNHALLSFYGQSFISHEIEDAQKQFEKDFSVMPLTFAYPGGSYNKMVIDTVEKAGFKTAVTVKAGSEQTEDELLLLKRTEVEGTDTILDLERKLKM